VVANRVIDGGSIQTALQQQAIRSFPFPPTLSDSHRSCDFDQMAMSVVETAGRAADIPVVVSMFPFQEIYHIISWKGHVSYFTLMGETLRLS